MIAFSPALVSKTLEKKNRTGTEEISVTYSRDVGSTGADRSVKCFLHLFVIRVTGLERHELHVFMFGVRSPGVRCVNIHVCKTI